MILTTGVQAGPNDNNDARFAAHAVPAPSGKDPTSPCPGALPSYDPNHFDHDLGEFGMISCRDYTVVRPVNEYPGPWVYVVVGQSGKSAGIKGVSFGIDYKVGDGVYGSNPVADPGLGQDLMVNQANYTLCTDGLDFPNAGANGMFPAPGGGIRITWASCQSQEVAPDGVHAVVAKFYVYAYSDDTFELTPNNNVLSGSELDVVDCQGVTTKLLSIALPEYVLGMVQFGAGRDGLTGFTPCGVVVSRPTTWGNLKQQFRQSVASQ